MAEKESQIQRKSTIAKVLMAMNQMMGIEKPVRRRTKKVGYEPVPQKMGPVKRSKPANDRRSFMERKSKKRRKMAAQSRRINRLRGVGI